MLNDKITNLDILKLHPLQSEFNYKLERFNL